jgi:sulfur-carrier protein
LPNLHVAEAEVPASEHEDVDVTRPVLRLFAAARQAAGVGSMRLAGATVGEVLDTACAAFGEEFVKVLATSRVWLNGQPTGRDAAVTDADELAVLPPVSGGA